MSFQSPQRWSLTPRALERLLTRLGAEQDAAAQEYELLRRKLITFFTLQGIEGPEEVADEAFDRVARRLEQGETIAHVRAYFHGVAQRIVSERYKQRVRDRAAVEVHRSTRAADDEADGAETRAVCLECCLRMLSAQDRALLHNYYERADGPPRPQRKALAAKLGLSYSNLKVRSYRIRRELESCLGRCLNAREGTGGRDV
jgi:DNA-directed RNA polymerase specialized sigma24 family protein